MKYIIMMRLNKQLKKDIIMAYVNFIDQYYEDGHECQGESTNRGIRIRPKRAFMGLMNPYECETDGSGFATHIISPTAFLMWYKDVHVLVRYNNKKIGFFISKNRIYSNNYGYYPETLFWVKPNKLKSTLQKIIRKFKQYNRITGFSCFVLDKNKNFIFEKITKKCSDCKFDNINASVNEAKNECSDCKKFLTWKMY